MAQNYNACMIFIFQFSDEISGRSICHESWGGMKRKLYGAFTNIMQFVLPFITIIFCYTAIIRKLEERAAHRPGAARY